MVEEWYEIGFYSGDGYSYNLASQPLQPLLVAPVQLGLVLGC